MPTHRLGTDAAPSSHILAYLTGRLSPADLARVRDMLAEEAVDEDPRPAGTPQPYRGPTGASDRGRVYAMDSAHPGRVVADREAAILEVERVVPRSQLIAMDSAANVFRLGLNAYGVDHLGLPDVTLPQVFRAHRDARRGTGSTPAMDGGAAAGRALARNPDVARIKLIA